MRGVHIIRKNLLMPVLLEADLIIAGVVGEFDDVSRGELEGLELAIELHLVPIPRVTVRTDQIVPMVRVGVTEIEVHRLDAVQVCNSNPYPRGQLLDPHSPHFQPLAV